jgi:hypothetical protein
VPPLTALENAFIAQRKTWKRNDNTLSQYLADLDVLWSNSEMSSFNEWRTCNSRIYEAPCRLDDHTSHRRDLSMLRAFS